MDSRLTNNPGSHVASVEPAASALSRLRRKCGGPSPMLVLGLIGVGLLVMLCVLGKFVFDRSDERTGRAVAKTKAKEIEEAAVRYHLVNGEYPDALDELTQPDSGNQGKPYLSGELLIDPWGQKFRFDPAGPHHQGELPDIYSVRPDGTVIGNW